MQMPDESTPVTKCLALGAFHRTVLAAFPEHDRLLRRMEAADAQLDTLANAHRDASIAMVIPRAKVRVQDYLTDQRVRLLSLAARSADGGRLGPVTQGLFPEGIREIVVPVGATAVVQIRQLEERLRALGGALAAEHLAPLTQARVEYEARIKERDDAVLTTSAALQRRDSAKTQWLAAYAANQGAIREAYPRDKKMQDLFFDDARSKSATPVDDSEDDPPTPTPAT